MPLIGGNSGFRTARDLILFVVGMTICLFHFFTTPSEDLSLPILLFGGGIAGAPTVLKFDEKKDRDKG